MKKQINPSAKAHLQSAFFSLRVLIGLFIVLVGVFLALAGLGAFLALAASMAQAEQKKQIITNSKDPLVPTATPTATATATPNLSPWTFVTRYPYLVEAPAVTSDGTFVYSAGGNHYGVSSQFFRYDPVANIWIPLANVLIPFYAARAVYAANTNSIYIFGGYTSSGALNATQIYNIGNGTWSYGAWMPGDRYFSNLAYCPNNQKIYVMGGFNSNNEQQSQTWEYDPVANTWNTSRTPIPMPMGGSGTGIVGNYIYLVGAWPAWTTHYRYDIVADSWSQMAPSPVYIYEPAAATVGTNIYIIGGGNPYFGAAYRKDGKLSPHSAPAVPADSYHTTFIYDTQSNTWTTGANLNLPRAFAAGTAIGSQLLVVGGFAGVNDTDTVETAFTEGGRVVCQYTITPDTDTIVLGTDDTGNHCDGFGCDTLISLPFPFQLYDQTFDAVDVSSNGRLGFVCYKTPGDAQCLPPLANACYDFSIFALWGRLSTLTDASGCSTWANGCGIFTSVSGTAPNRVFNIEWHTTLPQDPAQTQAYEVRLYENDPNKRFDVIYGTIDAPQSAGAWVDGVQGDLGAGQITRDFCPCCVGYPCTSCGWTPPQNVSRTYTFPPCAPMAQDAFSRKTHGAAGTFDIPLPLTGNVGIECRSGGGTNDYQMIINFATSVTVGSASLTSGVGSIIGFSVSGSQVTVNLTGVTNVQRITVTLISVNDGTHISNVPVSMGVLVSDVNGNAVVNASDVSLTKSQAGQPVTGSDFREDVNANGAINAADVGLVKARAGTALPP